MDIRGPEGDNLFDVLDEGNIELLFMKAWRLPLNPCLTFALCLLRRDVREIQLHRGSGAVEC